MTTSREKVTLTLVSLNLIFLGWCLGGFPIWALWTQFAVASAAFITVVSVPNNLKRLLRFPIFWLGLLFLGYVLVQALNPQWHIVTNSEGWWLEQIEHREGWPTSVISPFSEINPYRILVIMGSSLMMVCSIWLGLRSRKSILIALWVFGINGFFYAIIAILQSLIKAERVLGFVNWEGEVFFGSFFYRNHGAAYLYIVMSVLMGLTLYYFIRSWRRLDRSGPHVICGFMVVVTGLGFVFSQSRGGILAASLVGIVFLVALVVSLYRVYGVRVSILVLGVLLVLSWAASEWMYEERDLSLVESRFNEGEAGLFSGLSGTRRRLLMEATYEMFLDNPIFGWGAGSFRYYFPQYRVHYYLLDRAQYGVQAHYHHAHSDLMQVLAEYGIIGCSIFSMLLLYFLYSIFRYRSGLNNLVFMIFIGGLVLLLHSVVDFMLQSPSIWVTFCTLMILGLRMMKLVHKRA